MAALPITHQRKKMKQQAQQLVNNQITVLQPFNGNTMQKFNELSKWCSLSNPMCMKSFTFLAYEMQEKGWKKEWEKEFMVLPCQSYDSKVRKTFKMLVNDKAMK